jgi:hypothetical protein
MDADGESKPLVVGKIYNQPQAYQPTAVSTSSCFWNKKQFIWNIFNRVVCSPWIGNCFRVSYQARNELRCRRWRATGFRIVELIGPPILCDLVTGG